MKSLEEQMALYAAYHQDARTKATFVGVPLIMLAILIPLGWRPQLHRAVEQRAIQLRNSP